MTRPVTRHDLAKLLRGFFTDHLPGVRGLSRHTILSYRDAMILFLRYLAETRGCEVVDLNLSDFQPDEVIAFLEHLESARGNSVATRNARLAALHAFARYAANYAPEHLETCQRLLGVPFKRATHRVVEYLEGEELRALLDAIDRQTPVGCRDYALLLTLLNTGARVQELLDLRPMDLQLERPLQLRLYGKGRKERFCPLWPQTAAALRRLLAEQELTATGTERLFRNRRGGPLTRFGVRYLLRAYAARAQTSVPSLARKRIHPHTLRHTAAVHLLQAGVDIVSISHWLGHASIETTNRYAVIDLETKRDAIERAGPMGDPDIVAAMSPWRADTSVLAWLEAL
ncbi:MAG: tyrosine-type recombinase/integrase [Billgrantia desiderata]